MGTSTTFITRFSVGARAEQTFSKESISTHTEVDPSKNCSQKDKDLETSPLQQVQCRLAGPGDAH